MPDSSLQIHHLAVVDDNILGPGKRLVVWTAGCPFRCPGCIEEQLQTSNPGTSWQVDDFYALLAPHLVTLQAITFSGGEPLYQRQALLRMLHMIKDKSQVDVMLFTGMSTEQFQQHYTEFHPLIDLCVAEPFIREQHGDSLWRGSTNQCFLSPSEKYPMDQLNEWSKKKLLAYNFISTKRAAIPTGYHRQES